MDEEFGYGPKWTWKTQCCGKPVGCTNMSDQCLMKNHPWKRCNNVPELVGFVAARLDEDEAAANAGARRVGMPWRAEPQPGTPGGLVIDDLGLVGSTGGRYAADHIARHDPARVLREIEAKRAILTAYIKAEADGTSGDGWVMLRFAVEMLAAAWSDHPGYQPGWALAQVRPGRG